MATGSGKTVQMLEQPSSHREPKYVLRKLPQVTLLFWVLKTVAVTLGETAGDLLGITFRLGYVTTACLFLAFFLVVVVAQVRARRFHPALYWAVVLGTSMVGTEISDFMNRGFGHGSAPDGVGYAWGAVILTILLVLVFLLWLRTGQTYDVENISSRTGEILYWTAILVSNTLGTSSGDWLSDDTGLGFRGAFLVIAGIMLLIVAAHYLTTINGTVLFWLAFVLTRPLGAAGGDSLTKSVAQGGLGWGTVGGTAALCGLLVVLTAYQTWHVRSHPLAPLPAPVDRRTGRPQRPNGAPTDSPTPVRARPHDIAQL
ncbi:hypothetical protein ACIBL5_28525 [Streptomyces sp. NPDC050516]|uniref:hypothetical protein n=1 Tax=Streptomyces sp. NPDC050516 TaxID=3365621 RepID=UPI0037BD24DF